MLYIKFGKWQIGVTQMPDKKLTDEEIVRIMEICVNKTDVFVIHHNAETREYDQITIKDILGVINRQKEENERLTIRLRKAEHQLDDSMIMYNTIKTEAYKEFADKLCEGRVSNDNTVILAKCLLKELKGTD